MKRWALIGLAAAVLGAAIIGTFNYFSDRSDQAARARTEAETRRLGTELQKLKDEVDRATDELEQLKKRTKNKDPAN